MKFIFTFIFFLSINSINLYSQYDFKYIGNVNIIRDNKKINLDNSKKLFDKDIINIIILQIMEKLIFQKMLN